MIGIENEKQLKKYLILELIGQGTYGEVFHAKNIKTEEFVAMKKCSLTQNQGVTPQIIREACTLQQIKHPNIVEVKEIITTETEVYLILEKLEGDLTLDFKISKNQAPNYLKIKNYMYQLLQGISFFHNKRIIHRDLKPSNILFNKSGVLKIADFGHARAYSIPIRPLTNQVGTM